MRRAEHVDAVRDQMLFGGDELVIAADLEGEMLDPLRRILIAAHVGLVRQLEKGEDIAIPRVEEDVHIGIIFAGRRHMILGKRSEEHTSELQSIMRNSYAGFC